MKKLIVLFVIIVTGLVAASTGAETAVYEPKILASDAQKIIVEFTAPPLTVQPVVTREVSGQVIMMSGFSQTADPGAPQLPVQGYAIAVPENARPTLQILEQEVEVRTIPDIVPAPKMKKEIAAAIPDETAGEARIASTQPVQDETQYVYERDAEIYASNTFYPSEPVVIGSEAILRDVRLITVQLYPVQYNAAQNRAKVYKRLKFAVYFNGGSTTASAWSEQNSSPAFEDVYRSVLLNYEQSKAFRIDRQRLRKAAQDDYFLSQGSEWYKITLEKPGIYYITRADLEAAGMNLTGVDPRKFRMFNKGVEIAVNVIGEEDGSFDAGDQIEFYGTAFKNYYTTTNVYWLTVGSVNGKRMEVVDGSVVEGLPILIRGKEKLRVETDIGRRADFPGHTDQERWFMAAAAGNSNNPASTTLTVVLNNKSNISADDCVLRIIGRGISENNNINPDHHTKVELNGVTLWDHTWEGRIYYYNFATFNQTLLLEGNNSIKITSLNDLGAGQDYLYIDHYQLEYWRDYVARQDSIIFTAEANQNYLAIITGFIGTDRKLFDISDSMNVKKINNFTIDNDNLKFKVSLGASKKYFALTSAKRRPTSTSITKFQSASLRSVNNRADYVIIAHNDFEAAVQRIKNYRESQGLIAKVVTTQSIYDEFNYGFYEEKALRNFLSYCYSNWSQPIPAYILLVGDASWNPRILNPGVFGSEKSDFVPTRLFEAVEANFEAASDNYFGAVAGNDVLPEFLIGRIPARTSYQTQSMLEKIINYENAFKSGEWNRTSLFVADNKDDVAAFEDSSNAFQKDLVPSFFIKKRAYISELGPATKAAIIDGFNSGALIVNYFGHGATTFWAFENILTIPDVRNLRNDNKCPFVMTLSCINGYFVEPKSDNTSLAEVLLTERQRGAVAVFSGSGEAYPSPVLAMGRAAYKSLFQDRVRRVGSFTLAGLVRMAAAYSGFPDHVMFYIVFGDPGTELHYQPSQVAASAGYQGVLMLLQAPAPPGTGIVATIQKKVYAADIVGEKGAFGPLHVLADDPATPEKDGGAPGDRVVFYAVVGKDTLVLTPAYEWKAGEIQQVKLQQSGTSVDQIAEIALYADDKKYGEEWIDGDCLARTASLTAHITPRRWVLDASSVQIVVDGEPLSFEQYRVTTVQEEGPKLKATLSLNGLPDGEHEIKVQVIGESAQAEQTARFALQSKLSLKDVVNFPNPMKEETKFTFTLQNDRPAEIEIKLYTIAGRLIRTFKQTVSVGYNEIPWDGQDAEGDELANGLYFYKIVADDGEEKAEVTERLVVMK